MSADAVLAIARARGVRFASAESCTGGMIAAALTDIPGSSEVFERGFVTYSNASKVEMLGVGETTLADHGAVSEEVAAEMAVGALRRSLADIAVAVTGIAGPGGSEHKPEGRVCFALTDRTGNLVTKTIEFGAMGRGKVRTATVAYALGMLFETLTA